MLEDFPPHVQATVQRILDAAARRLLAESLTLNPDADSVAASAQLEKEAAW